MFYNTLEQEWTDDATEMFHGRWYIKCGFAGFNSYTNNHDGYITQEAAEAAINWYQSS